jgi:hypothetical protein
MDEYKADSRVPVANVSSIIVDDHTIIGAGKANEDQGLGIVFMRCCPPVLEMVKENPDLITWEKGIVFDSPRSLERFMIVLQLEKERMGW